MNNLEKSFKEALTDFDQVSPSKGLWSRISTSLFFKSNGFKATLFGLLALLFVGISTVLTLSKSQNAEYQTPLKRTHFALASNYRIKSQLTSSPKTTDTKAPENTTVAINQKAESINSKPIQTKSISNNKSTVKSTQIVKSKEQSDISKNSKAEPLYIASKQTATSNKNMAKPIIVLGPSVKNSNLTTKTQASNSKPTTLNSKEAFSSTENIKEKDIEKVPLLELSLNNQREDFVSKYSIPLYSRKQIYSNQLEIFAGPNIAFNNFKIEDKSFEDHINLRTESESPKLSYHAGLNYKTYYKKWFVSLGLNYHRIEDRATYSIPTIEIDSAISSYMIFSNKYHQTIVGYIQNPNDTNSLIPVIEVQVTQDTTTVNTVYYDSTKSVKSYSYTNSYSYIEVPLLVGREFNYKHFVFDVIGGVSWGRLVKSQVNIPSTSNQHLMDFDQTDAILVKNTFNGILGVGIGYRINEGNILFIRPNLRYNLSSMFEKDYPINQKYLQVRVSFGIRIKL